MSPSLRILVVENLGRHQGQSLPGVRGWSCAADTAAVGADGLYLAHTVTMMAVSFDLKIQPIDGPEIGRTIEQKVPVRTYTRSVLMRVRRTGPN